MRSLPLVLCGFQQGVYAFLGRYVEPVTPAKPWEVGGPVLSGWRGASAKVEKPDPEAFELFPKSYYGMGQFLTRDVQPEKISTLFESDRFLKEIEPVVRSRLRVALSDHWDTKIASKKQRIDGFKSPALAFVEANKVAIRTVLSGKGALSPDREIIWSKIVFDINFGNVPGLQGWATPEEAAKALKQAQIADDVPLLLSGMRNALIDVYQQKMDQPSTGSSRAPTMHRQFLTASKAKQGGILQLRRDLICFQSEVSYIAKSDEYRNASKVANFMIPAVIGRIHFLSSDTSSSNKATFEGKRFEHPIRASSRWHFMHYEPVGLFQTGVDDLHTADEEQVLFTPYRGHLDEKENVARKSLKKVVDERVAAAPEFVCPQAPVLSRNGYRNHCVHLGARHHSVPEALSADEMFALKCAGLFPIQTSVVSVKMTQVPGKKNAVKERWVGRICTAKGWTKEIHLTDRRGEAVSSLCQRNAEKPTPALDMVKMLHEALPQNNRRKRAAVY